MWFQYSCSFCLNLFNFNYICCLFYCLSSGTTKTFGLCRRMKHGMRPMDIPKTSYFVIHWLLLLPLWAQAMGHKSNGAETSYAFGDTVTLRHWENGWVLLFGGLFNEVEWIGTAILQVWGPESHRQWLDVVSPHTSDTNQHQPTRGQHYPNDHDYHRLSWSIRNANNSHNMS